MFCGLIWDCYDLFKGLFVACLRGSFKDFFGLKLWTILGSVLG